MECSITYSSTCMWNQSFSLYWVFSVVCWDSRCMQRKIIRFGGAYLDGEQIINQTRIIQFHWQNNAAAVGPQQIPSSLLLPIPKEQSLFWEIKVSFRPGLKNSQWVDFSQMGPPDRKGRNGSCLGQRFHQQAFQYFLLGCSQFTRDNPCFPFLFIRR